VCAATDRYVKVRESLQCALTDFFESMNFYDGNFNAEWTQWPAKIVGSMDCNDGRIYGDNYG